MLTAISLLLASTLAAPAPCVPTTVVPLSFSALCQAADTVVTATVAASECRYVDGKRTIRTFVTLREVLLHRGVAGTELVLQLEGGRIGDDTLKVPGMPQLLVGHRYLLFIAQNGVQPSPIVGFWQGLFEVITQDGREQLVTSSRMTLLDVRNDRLVLLAPQRRAPAVTPPAAVRQDGKVVDAAPTDGGPCALVSSKPDQAPIVVAWDQDPGTRLGVADVVQRRASLRREERR